MAASRGFVLGVLIANGVFEPGLDKLSCCVGGVEYHAQLGPNGEIWFENKVFKSPSAFSVYVKRKINPTRKADDGWTSVRYQGEVLSSFRSQLEQLLAAGAAGTGPSSAHNAISYTEFASNSASSGGSQPATQGAQMGGPGGANARAPKRKGRPKSGLRELSEDEGGDMAYGGQQQRPRGRPRSRHVAKYSHSGFTPQRRQADKPEARHGGARPLQYGSSSRQRGRSLSPPDDRAFSDQHCWEAAGGQQYEGQYDDDGEEEQQQEADAPYAQADLAYTWLQCTRQQCSKWRRVPAGQPRRAFVCEDNPLPGFQDCSVVQEVADEQVGLLRDDERAQRHVASSSRPPLGRCSSDAFEEDLCLFLVSQREEALATLVREHRIMCNNLPLDLFGLYREVVAHGGLLDNERYDERGRWTGGINFAGEVFVRMRNYTPNNRATSVGNQLLNNYKKFLLKYERAWRHKDMPQAGPPPPLLANVAPQPVIKMEPGVGGRRLQRQLTSPSPTSDPLALLADIANAGSDDSRPSTSAPLATGLEARVGSCDGPLQLQLLPPAPERKRRRTDDGTGTLLGAEGAAAMEEDVPLLPGAGDAAGAAGERRPALSMLVALCEEAAQALQQHAPGSVLLAQDPRDLSSHWAVVVADAGDVPAAVAAGGVAGSAARQGFPQSMREASASGHPSDAIPVLVLGTDAFGWVEAAACRPFSTTAGQSAAASAWAALARDSLGGSLPSGPLRDDDHALLACVRGLKLALQLHGSCDAAAAAAVARGWVRAAATAATAARLLQLEGQLAGAALCNGGAAFWEVFRGAVRAARSAHELAPQVLMLAYQIEPDLLRSDAADAMWDDMQELLGMACAATAGAGSTSSSAGLSGQSGMLPSSLSVDAAVGVLEEAIDWARARAMWGAAAQVEQCMAPLQSQHPVQQPQWQQQLQQQQAQHRQQEQQQQQEEQQPMLLTSRSCSADDVPRKSRSARTARAPTPAAPPTHIAATAAEQAALDLGAQPSSNAQEARAEAAADAAATAADADAVPAVSQAPTTVQSVAAATASVAMPAPVAPTAVSSLPAGGPAAAATGPAAAVPVSTASATAAAATGAPAAAVAPASGARPPRAPVLRVPDAPAAAADARLHTPAAVVSEAMGVARNRRTAAGSDSTKGRAQPQHVRSEQAMRNGQSATGNRHSAHASLLASGNGTVHVKQEQVVHGFVGPSLGHLSQAMPTMPLLPAEPTETQALANQQRPHMQQPSKLLQQPPQQLLQPLQQQEPAAASMSAQNSSLAQLRELSFSKMLAEPLLATFGSPFAQQAADMAAGRYVGHSNGSSNGGAGLGSNGSSSAFTFNMPAGKPFVEVAPMGGAGAVATTSAGMNITPFAANGHCQGQCDLEPTK